MPGFYDHLAPEDVTTLDRLARLLIELRESRAALLARHGVKREDLLLEKLQRAQCPEHPAYEDYLGAKIIGATCESLRTELRDYLLRINQS